MRYLAFLFFFVNPLFAQQDQPPRVGTDHFGGLNDTDTPGTLQNFESQNAINVEANLSNTAIKQRYGYARIASLTISTAPVTGAYTFIDKNGSQEAIVCQDLNCSNSVNGGAFAVLYSTATKGVSRWSFTDNNGTVYAVDDKNDQPWSYDGTTFTIPFSTSVPLGSLIEQSKDRLVLAGVATNPSTVYYSQSGAFVNFTTGINSADPWTDQIGTTGDKVTALKYDSGNLYIFKRNSITLCILADQYSTVCYPIANTIGTNSPLSIVSAPDGIYFQSQTGTYWKIPTYGLYGLELVSKKITNFVKSQPNQFGNTGSNLQGTMSDWNAGTQTPLSSFNIATIPGAIFQASSTFVDNTSTLGVFISSSNISTNTISGEFTLFPATFSFTNGDLSQNTIGQNGSSVSGWTFNAPTNWSVIAGTAYSCPAAEGGVSLQALSLATNGNLSNSSFRLLDQNGNILKNCTDLTSTITCARTTSTCTDFDDGTTAGFNLATIPSTVTAISLQFYTNDGVNYARSINATPTSKNAFTIVTSGLFPNCRYTVAACGVQNYGVSQTGNYVSRTFDTGFSTPTAGPFNVVESSNTDGAVTFQIQDSSDNVTFGSLATATPGVRLTNVRRYWRYKPTFTNVSSTQTAQVTSVNLAAATTGQFVTQCIQSGSNITSWDLLTCDTSSNIGAGSEVFYATSAVNCASLPTTPPLTSAGALQNGWTQQTNNTAINISTNAAFLLGWRDLLGSTTDQAQVNDCVTNWLNGIQPQPVWGAYDPIKNSIYWSTANNGLGKNNRILKYDLNANNNGVTPWFPWAVDATALRMFNNSLYFGSASSGTWNEFIASGNSDNGTTITSNWQSKDFNCNNPFVDSVWGRAYVVAKNQQAGGITETVTTSLGSVDTYTINTSTSSTLNYVRSTHSIQNFSPAPFANINFTNTTQNVPFQINGFSMDCIPQGPIDENP